MRWTQFKLATATVAAASVLVAGTGWLTLPVRADPPPVGAGKDAARPAGTEMAAVVKAVDPARNTVTVYPGKGESGDRTYAVARDVRVFLDDGTGDRLGFEDGKLTDLADGCPITLRFSADRSEVVRVWVDGPTVTGVLKAVDPAANTLTATVTLSKTEPAAERSFTVARSARISIEDGRPVDKTKPVKAPTLADLPPNAVVSLRLSADRKVVGGIRAEGPTVGGTLKAVDPAGNTVTVTISVKGEPDADRTFTVDPAAHVSIDEPAADKAKPVKGPGLGEVPVGAAVTLRLSPDQKAVVAIRAEGATVHGTVKAVDAGKGAITLADKVEGEKAYPVAKDAAVTLDGKGEARKLADVPVGSVVTLRLRADRKSVRDIAAVGPTVHGTVRGTGSGITIEEKEGQKTFPLAADVRIVVEEARPGKLAELIDGTEARLHLSADQSTALEVYAEGPRFRGIIKAVDPDKDAITLLIGSKNGVGGEDKDFRLPKETVVTTEVGGATLKRTDLRPEREVELRLTIDQKAAGRITVLGE